MLETSQCSAAQWLLPEPCSANKALSHALLRFFEVRLETGCSCEVAAVGFLSDAGKSMALSPREAIETRLLPRHDIIQRKKRRFLRKSLHSIKDTRNWRRQVHTVANVIRLGDGSPRETFEKVRRSWRAALCLHMGARLMASQPCSIALVSPTVTRGGPASSRILFVSRSSQPETEVKGYFGCSTAIPIWRVPKMALAWNVEGVIVLGCKRQGYYTLREQLDVLIVIDTCFQEGIRLRQ